MAQRTILVTGANKGIGLEICRQLARLEMRVILTARDKDKGLEAVKLLEPEKGTVEFHQLDVTDPASIAALHDFLHQEVQQLDGLINNAGIGVGTGGADEADIQEMRAILETNLFGPIQLTQALLPLLKKSSDGRIVNVSSGMGSLTNMGSGYAGYRISKTALNSFTAVLAQDLADTNITVNTMHPGWVRTDMGGQNAERSVEEGADTAVWLATAPNLPSGKFFMDRKEIPW